MATITRTKPEVAEIIERFLDGTCGRWDWDDLCSIKIQDPELDHVRVLCESACFTFPPTEEGHYCSAAGREYLRALAERLRQGNIPA